MSTEVKQEKTTVKLEGGIEINSEDNNNFSLVPMKKKRIRKRRIVALMPMPRIPRSDIRRQYARMFSNVYNSCDFDLLNQYMQQFYRQDLAVPVHAVISYASGKDTLSSSQALKL